MMRKSLILVLYIAFIAPACAQNTQNSPTNAAKGQLDFTHAASVTTPAVVHVKTYSTMVRGGTNPLEELFKEFYGDSFPGDRQQRNQQQEPEEQLYASGSGVIISNDGYIVTSNHITENAERIEVILNDKRTFEAEIVGFDEATDVALLKVQAEDLPVIQFGNSDSVQVGEWVVAVGNPFNLTSTVTAGIVSAKGRNINVLGDRTGLAIESFIQTDAAVNPGNSGGALVDLEGKLVGINTAIASPTGTFAGYSFAVPVNLVKKSVEDIREFGKVQRGLLGIMIRDINAELANEENLSQYSGVFVAEVREEGAAAEAGVKQGDVITAVDGNKVNTSAHLQEIIALKRPGDEVTLTIRRNGKTRELEATLKSRDGSTEVSKLDPDDPENRAGAQFMEPEKDELLKLGIPGGAKVAELASGKFREAGVRNGFIITKIDKKKITSVKDARKALEKVKDGGVLIEGYYPEGEKAFYAIGF